MSAVKQVIAVRRDLKMRRGKEAAQVAHAAMEFLREMVIEEFEDSRFTVGSLVDQPEVDWIQGDHAKIVVQVADEAELLTLEAAAQAAGLCAYVITDVGATEFHGVPTKTCVAIGPDRAEKIDPVCGHLKLY